MYHEYDRDLIDQIRSCVTALNAGGEESLSGDLLRLLWSTSSRNRGEIEAKLRMGLKDDVLGLMKFVPDWKTEFGKDVKKPRKLSWFMSNLGVLNGKPEPEDNDQLEGLPDSWSICRAQFTISTEVPVGALLFTVVIVKYEQLAVACTWQDTVVEHSLVEKVMEDMRKWLNQIGAAS